MSLLRPLLIQTVWLKEQLVGGGGIIAGATRASFVKLSNCKLFSKLLSVYISVVKEATDVIYYVDMKADKWQVG